MEEAYSINQHDIEPYSINQHDVILSSKNEILTIQATCSLTDNVKFSRINNENI